jgi:UDP-N-acetylmuramoyl-tripeptide--D-alanyl-D-alanine ligase
VILKFHKYQWHILYFILPIATYYLAGKFYWIYLIFGVLPSLFIWYKKLDKKLVFTARVKRFFALLVFLTLLSYVFDYYFKAPHGVFLPIILTLIGSEIIEYIIFNGYKKQAKNRLSQINPKIIAITASYGKTSIKNYLYQLLEDKFNTYKTPRSVNTLKGIVADINNNLSTVDIYIVEAGAREKGDIKEIVEFLENEYAIIGKIGPQHIEYFKTIENIINTKKEILLSKNLKKAITYDIDEDKCIAIKDKIKNIKATLEGIEWDLEYKDKTIHLNAPILGEFNAINISLAFYMAKELRVDTDYLIRKIAKLSPIPHRLQKIEVGGKIIIDDSFNGNIEGMLSSINLVSTYNGRKVIITPGIVEATKEMNEKLAKRIDEVFDIVIVTGSLNRHVLCQNIHKPNKIYLANKDKLEKILSENTKAGDLILFSNDAPNFI